MRPVCLLAALSLIGLTPHESPAQTSSQSQASAEATQQPVIIDGAKNPELFPEWFIWELVFESFPSQQPTPAKPSVELPFGVSEADRAILAKEATVFRQSKEVLRKQLKETRAALLAQGKSEDQIRDATQEVNLQYRHTILDARGRVHQALSAAGFEGLKKWINQQLSGTTVHLRGRTAKYFHLPY